MGQGIADLLHRAAFLSTCQFFARQCIEQSLRDLTTEGVRSCYVTDSITP